MIDLSGASTTMLAGQVVGIGAGVIENAFGGDGDDVLKGSVKANVLTGGRGNDALYFSAGNDRLDGQQGNDTLFVNAKFADLAGYVTKLGEVALSAATGTITLISNVESFVFADATYTLAQLLLHLGDDTTDPGDGDGDGDDGGDPGDGSGDGSGDGGGDDAGDDDGDPADPGEEPVRNYTAKLTGKTGDDTLRAGKENTQVEGLGGNDYLVGARGDDELQGDAGIDLLRGGRGADYLFGGDGDDRLLGDEGNDRLYGGLGKDALNGGLGADIIQGGRGGDKLKGGAEGDTFVFDLAEIDSVDVIADFNAAEGDRILITGLGTSDAGDFQFVVKGRHTFLQLKTDKGAVDIVQIQGVGLDGLEIQASELGLYFA